MCHPLSRPSPQAASNTLVSEEKTSDCQSSKKSKFSKPCSGNLQFEFVPMKSGDLEELQPDFKLCVTNF